jgi:Zn-dependent protease with chaperone function
MGYVLQLVLALAIVALADSGLALEGERPWALPLLVPVPFAAALLSRRLALRGRFRAANAVGRLLRLTAPACFAAALLALGWGATVERLVGGRPSLLGWPDLPLVAGLAPYLVLELLTIEARARLAAHGVDGVRAYRSFQRRLFLSTLTPFALYGALAGAVGWSDAVRVPIEEVALLDTAFSAGIVLLFASTLPGLLRRAWDTAPLERGTQRELLEAVAGAARFEYRDLLVWRTGGSVANAAIVGFTRRHRLVIFTDALLRMLDPLELAAVFGHEIGHARGRHPLVFAAWALGFFLGAGLLLELFGSVGDAGALALLGGALVLFWGGFGWMSRRFELEADLTSAELTDGGPALIRALERVSGPLHGGRKSWRHFSTERRIAFLEDCRRDPELGERLRARLRWLARAGVLLFVVALAGRVVLDARRVPADLVFVDLRHARFEQAAERYRPELELGEPYDTALAELVRELEQRPDGVPLVVAEAEELARAAARAEDPERAAAWLLLAEQAGSEDAGRVLAAIALAGTVGPAPATEALRAADQRWRAPFQPLIDAATPRADDP